MNRINVELRCKLNKLVSPSKKEQRLSRRINMLMSELTAMRDARLEEAQELLNQQQRGRD